MSAKSKDKIDDTAFVTSDNKDKRILISATTTTIVELKKDIFIKIRELAIFIEDRIKFTAYKTFIGLAVWADNKREKINRTIKIISEQMVWAASFLTRDAYKSFKPYMTYFLSKRGLASSCEAPMKKIFNNLYLYFALLGQSYEDLNETRTVK
jgi:hypothetical protein